jgi:two-component system LytT family response regulator
MMMQELAPDIQIIAEAASANEGLALIEQHKPDFILLDIEMPGISGIDLVEILLEKRISCEVIFTTAYNEYAIRAFRLSAIDYLLKPINEPELLQAIDKLRNKKALQESDRRLQVLSQNLSQNKANIISIPVLNGYEYIPVQDIEYIEASGSYAQIQTVQAKNKTVSKNLKFFEEALQGFSQFIRVHRSFIINIEQMKLFSRSDGGVIMLNSGKEVSLARERRAIFLELMEKRLH